MVLWVRESKPKSEKWVLIDVFYAAAAPVNIYQITLIDGVYCSDRTIKFLCAS